MPYYLTQENLVKLRKQFIEHKIILLNMLVALVMLGTVTIFVSYEQIFAAWSVLFIALILVTGLDRSIQKIFSFEQYFRKKFGFTYESIAIQANLPLSHRNLECQIEGPIETKFAQFFQPHTLKEFFWKMLHFGALLIAVATLIILFQASYIDYQRSQNGNFAINYREALKNILKEQPPPSSETQTRQLDPNKTPPWVVEAIKLVDSINQLVASKEKLKDYLEKTAEIDPQTAKAQAQKIALEMMTLLSEIKQNSVLPESWQNDVEELKRKLDSIHSSSNQEIEEQQNRLENSSIFSYLDSLKEQITPILNELSGENSGFSTKVKALYEKSMMQASENQIEQSDMLNTLEQLKNQLQEELAKFPLYQAPTTLQRLEEQLAKELQQISVFVQNVKPFYQLSSESGSPNSSSSQKSGIGSASEPSTPNEQRQSDSGAVEIEQTLHGQESPISYAPPSI
jgi:hypothetical protein